MNRTHIFLFSTVLILSGCSVNYSVNSRDEDLEVLNQNRISEDTQLSGKLIQVGDNYFLISSTGQQTALDSYSIDFSQYVDSAITVVGQYSGETLFASEVIASE